MEAIEEKETRAEPEETVEHAEPEAEPQSEETRENDMRLFGRAIAEELRGVIDEELDRRFAAMTQDKATSEKEDALRALSRDPRFLRLLSEKLALEGGRRESATGARRRGASLLPATAKQSPKTFDEAKSAARKYFRID